MLQQFDYLNECIAFWGRSNRRDATYKRAQMIKRRGDAYLFNLLCSEYTSRFRWGYEPPDGRKTIATELIEQTILFGGMVAFMKLHLEHGSYAEDTWRNFRVSGADNQSFYSYPNKCTLTDYAGKTYGEHIPVQEQEDDTFADCVMIYDNFSGWSPLWTIFYYVDRLSVINTSIEACVHNILGTSVITCTKEQARDIEKQRTAAAIGVPYIIHYDEDDLKPPSASIMSTSGASDELRILYSAFDKTHHDYLQSIGIRVNSEIDKQTGVTPMEIIENRMNVDLILNDSLATRKKGIELAKRIGLEGLSVSLDNFENRTGDYDRNGNKIPADNQEKDPAEPEGGGEDNA